MSESNRAEVVNQLQSIDKEIKALNKGFALYLILQNKRIF